MPKVSVVIPIYEMNNAKYFLERNLESILKQTFKDYEIIITDDSDNDLLQTWLIQKKYPVRYFKNKPHGMAYNSNNGILKATGELIKLLYQDDYLYDENSLGDIVKAFTPNFEWLVTSCTHSTDGIQTFNNHEPWYQESENTIGSPSVLTIRKNTALLFDPQFHWVLDLDLYRRLQKEYGNPKILRKINVVIGLHPGQKTNLLSDQAKLIEHQKLKLKYENFIRSR